jgi:hypothetical protein
MALVRLERDRPVVPPRLGVASEAAVAIFTNGGAMMGEGRLGPDRSSDQVVLQTRVLPHAGDVVMAGETMLGFVVEPRRPDEASETDYRLTLLTADLIQKIQSLPPLPRRHATLVVPHGTSTLGLFGTQTVTRDGVVGFASHMTTGDRPWHVMVMSGPVVYSELSDTPPGEMMPVIAVSLDQALPDLPPLQVSVRSGTELSEGHAQYLREATRRARIEGVVLSDREGKDPEIHARAGGVAIRVAPIPRWSEARRLRTGIRLAIELLAQVRAIEEGLTLPNAPMWALRVPSAADEDPCDLAERLRAERDDPELELLEIHPESDLVEVRTTAAPRTAYGQMTSSWISLDRDPQWGPKGSFGFLPERDGWRIDATRTTDDSGATAVDLEITSTLPGRPLRGHVGLSAVSDQMTAWHSLEVHNGVARHQLRWVRPTTIGIHIAQDDTELELELDDPATPSRGLP